MSAERNECYPSMPAVGWAPKRGDVKARRAAMDFRDALVAERGARLAADAAKLTGGNIGGQKKGKAS